LLWRSLGIGNEAFHPDRSCCFVFIAAIAIFLLGAAWRFGGWIAEWVGRLFGVRGLTSSYETFVQSYAGMLMSEGSIARILGPWLLMGIGLVVLAMFYLSARDDSKAS
jgi:hypothetical protein